MRRLTLAGCSKDGSRLLLVSDDGTEFSLAVDNRLRAALTGDPARTWAQNGQLEIQMESMLRPRDIQARIRAGESPEEVAAAAQTTVEQIMPYAGPVLAERAHIADRAQRSSLRRAHETREPGPRTLRDSVAAVLRAHNVDPDRVEWDAWRREDGRWQLVAVFATAERAGVAEFHFDLPGNFVLPANGDASWLVGDTPVIAPAPAPSPRAAQARHLGVVEDPDEAPRVRPADAPIGQDALELVRSADSSQAEPAWESEMPLDAFFADDPDVEPAGGTTRRTAEDTEVDPEADTAITAPVRESSRATTEEPVEEVVAREETVIRRREVRKSRGRASVPSWDEIMFGGGPAE